MGILDEYKKALEEEKAKAAMNMDFPEDGGFPIEERDVESYQAELQKLRCGNFTNEEIQEAINNSRNNMKELGEDHYGGANEKAMIPRLTKVTTEELDEKGLLTSEPVSDIRVIRAFCPICGKELVSKAPPMYNPFTMEKMCIHDCCGQKFNLDKTYPHIGFFDANGNEIESFCM